MIKAILAIWVGLITASLIGWGCLAQVLLVQFNPDKKIDPPHALMAGLFVITLLGLIANFWTSLTVYAGLYTILPGFVLLFLYRNMLAAAKSTWIAAVAAMAWVVWGLPYDSLFNDAGLYHLQFEQWIAHSPILWGLANVQTRFGFDSTWLIFVSAVRVDLGPSVSPWMHAIAADMAIRAFLFWWLIVGFGGALKLQDPLGKAFYGSGFIFLSLFLWRMREAGTDNPANLIAIAIFLMLYESYRFHDRFEVQRAIAAICGVALLVTSKLSILPLALLAAPIIFSAQLSWKQFFVICLTASLLVVAWIIRNFVLTGCLVYPAAITCMDVPWGLGAEMARSEAWSVTAFARTHMGPGIILQRSMESVTNFSFEWFLEWLKHFPHTYYFRVTLSAISVGVIGWVLWGRKQAQRLNAWLWLPLVVSFLAFLYWLILGPDPRFAWAIFYIVSVVSVSLIWGKTTSAAGSLDARSVNIFVCMLIAAVGLLIGVYQNNSIDSYRFTRYALTPFEYEGVTFYLGETDHCGEQLLCVGNAKNIEALDKFISANPNVRLLND